MNKIFFNYLFAIFLTILFSKAVFSQERLVSINENIVVKNLYNKSQTHLKSKAVNDTLELPFFDDFSTSTIYPDTNLWIDKYAFVNTSFGINPPSIGVVTLDAISYNGTHYTEASSNPFIADKLTSKPINLNYHPDSSIFLSFYYQAQGIGDKPEVDDSLLLEFYSPNEKIWHSIWNTPGDTSQNFKQVILPITDTTYLKKGFRFRFKNYASLAGDYNPSATSNVDQWNIDYIKLDKHRNINDTIIHDVAFVQPPSSILKTYSSMPWKHFISVFPLEIQQVSFNYRNNDNIIRNITSMLFFNNLINNTKLDSFFVNVDNYQPFEHTIYNFKLDNNPFPITPNDSALFEVKCKVKTDDFDYEGNNIATFKQKFYNYYAYDDGTAENGYGIDSKDAMLAYKFKTYKTDTLQAVNMYFNQSNPLSASQRSFKLTIWDDDDGKPGNIVYQQIGIRPEYENELNKFHTYILPDSVNIIVSDIFYVGWTQTSDAFLNIGFDMNRASNSNIFYNLNGNWYNSSFEGSLMIRPVLGKPIKITTTAINKIQSVSTDVKLYPNPVKDKLFLRTNNQNINNLHVVIFNNIGKLVYSGKINNGYIDVNNYNPGIYFIRIKDKNSFVINKKFIVIH
ncbi:MAG: T9SS type A sorting domain-containing protein [Bacteroidales bacterium]|nr:T9SS type A sorting domain-containing protein [Bacteroidales bacterium]